MQYIFAIKNYLGMTSTMCSPMVSTTKKDYFRNVLLSLLYQQCMFMKPLGAAILTVLDHNTMGSMSIFGTSQTTFLLETTLTPVNILPHKTTCDLQYMIYKPALDQNIGMS